jgi:hypothetical protein
VRKIRNRLVHTPISAADCVGSIGACSGRVRLGFDAREWAQSPSTVHDLDKDINILGTFVLGQAPPTISSVDTVQNFCPYLSCTFIFILQRTES